jgi:NAD(P)H-binding
MILVTGATGTVGREVVRALSGTGQTFMVMVRSEAARKRLEWFGIPIVAIDCDEPAQPNVALIGTGQVFQINPGGRRQMAQESAAIDAAHKVSVRRIVKQSAMGADNQSPCAFQRGDGAIERHLVPKERQAVLSAEEISGGWRVAVRRIGRTESTSSRLGPSGPRTEPLRRKAQHSHSFRSCSCFPEEVDLVA